MWAASTLNRILTGTQSYLSESIKLGGQLCLHRIMGVRTCSAFLLQDSVFTLSGVQVILKCSEKWLKANSGHKLTSALLLSILLPNRSCFQVSVHSNSFAARPVNHLELLKKIIIGQHHKNLHHHFASNVTFHLKLFYDETIFLQAARVF